MVSMADPSTVISQVLHPRGLDSGSYGRVSSGRSHPPGGVGDYGWFIWFFLLGHVAGRLGLFCGFYVHRAGVQRTGPGAHPIRALAQGLLLRPIPDILVLFKDLADPYYNMERDLLLYGLGRAGETYSSQVLRSRSTSIWDLHSDNDEKQRAEINNQ